MRQTLLQLAAGENPKGTLCIEAAAQGLTACYLNASDLVHESRLLHGAGRDARALSLAILASEELAKVPELFDLFTHPQRRLDASEWAGFWRRFVSHGSKQERIATYGEGLRALRSSSVRQSPYRHYLDKDYAAPLDRVKQRGFYVDFFDGSFAPPPSDDRVLEVLSGLLAFLEERLDSFGAWHRSAQRSLDFLAIALPCASKDDREWAEAERLRGTFNEWASTRSSEESIADLICLLSKHSAGAIPDYATFKSEYRRVTSTLPRDQHVESLVAADGILEQRMKALRLVDCTERAWAMRKLVKSYCDEFLLPGERSTMSRVAHPRRPGDPFDG